MPHIDGLALARQLRQQPGFVETPFFCVSAYADQVYRDQATAAGFAGYLAKPVSIDQLMATLEKARASVALAKELAGEHHRVLEQSCESVAATARAVEEASRVLGTLQRANARTAPSIIGAASPPAEVVSGDCSRLVFGEVDIRLPAFVGTVFTQACEPGMACRRLSSTTPIATARHELLVPLAPAQTSADGLPQPVGQCRPAPV